MMLFHEIYGNYYRIMEMLIKESLDGELSQSRMTEIILQEGFGETMLNLPELTGSGNWNLLSGDFETPLNHQMRQPLTILQKRWLKALLADPRIRLFQPDDRGLEDVKPLYPAGAIDCIDRYADGDPFEDADYIARFRLLRKAIAEHRWVRIRFSTRYDVPKCWKCVALSLEYSPKDDKFRLVTAMGPKKAHINLARVHSVELLEPAPEVMLDYRPKLELVAELYDQRNAMERAMLHFSQFEKETIRVDENQYELHLYYEEEDETELLIRILQFGPFIKVLEPSSMVSIIKERLQMQKNIQKMP